MSDDPVSRQEPGTYVIGGGSSELLPIYTDIETGGIGAGAELDIGFGRTYGEAKYIIGRDDVSQLILGVGMRVSM